jgi:hypothetical protein
MQRFSALLALSLTMLPHVARAQSSGDLDMDEEDGGSRAETRRKDPANVVVREIERGPYLKANAGTTAYIGARAGLLRPGTTLDLTFGYDVVDKTKASASVELNFYQGMHNAKFSDYSEIAGAQPNQLIEGDVHVFGLFVGAEGSYYPVRRFGIGGHAGGGVAFVPLLMNRQYYDTDVIPTWGGAAFTPAVHQGPKPAIYVGPTIEYYTKLSHFSIGVDADFIYVIGLDYGISATGYFKYSF